MADEPEERTRVSTGGLVGAGCFSAVAGFFGGGMMAVLVAKFVGSYQGCKPPEGLPACNWGSYALVGMVAGVVIVPLVTIIRLTSRRS
jgi:hypothetical protein